MNNDIYYKNNLVNIFFRDLGNTATSAHFSEHISLFTTSLYGELVC